jgi:hypothetical protein
VLERLGEAVLGALKQREIATALETQADIAPLGPAALAARLRRDFDERGAGIRAASFTAGQG